MPLVSRASWSRLTESQRDAVRLGWQEAEAWAREYTVTELERGVAASLQHGISSQSPSSEDRQRMRERLIGQQDILVEQGRMDPDFVARVQARLAELQ
ncbi:hypothetical protein D3C83_65780 [compost metagenome]